MMCYELSCRLCLKELQGPGIDCMAIIEIRNAISDLFGVRISHNDITTSICNKCFESVMSYKAFKKTVVECQTIIREYETIKSKILQRGIFIKQEIIDLSDADSNGQPGPSSSSNNKRRKKCPGPGKVTDSQINDILDLVHDNSKGSSKPSDTSKQAKANSSQREELPIKRERLSPQRSTSQTSTTEPTSSLNPETSDKNRESNKRLSSSNVISTSGIPETSQIAIKAETDSNVDKVPVPVDSSVEVVTSSVQTPTRDEAENEVLPTLPQSSQENASPQHPMEPPKPVEKSAATSKLSSTKFHCPHCSSQFKSQNDLTNHSMCHTEIIKNEEKTGNKKRKTPNDEVSEREKSPEVKVTRRSARLANSQARSWTSPLKPRRYSTPTVSSKKAKTTSSVKSSPRKNNSLDLSKAVEQYAATKQIKSPGSPTGSCINVKPVELENPPKRTKRIITITLLRSKDNVNFRYCDQYKNAIAFESVTAEELRDIRSSLMIPDIWNNLTNVFKTSPPDEKTVEQLKTIFGQSFRI